MNLLSVWGLEIVWRWPKQPPRELWLSWAAGKKQTRIVSQKYLALLCRIQIVRSGIAISILDYGVFLFSRDAVGRFPKVAACLLQPPFSQPFRVYLVISLFYIYLIIILNRKLFDLHLRIYKTYPNAPILSLLKNARGK